MNSQGPPQLRSSDRNRTEIDRSPVLVNRELYHVLSRNSKNNTKQEVTEGGYGGGGREMRRRQRRRRKSDEEQSIKLHGTSVRSFFYSRNFTKLA